MTLEQRLIQFVVEITGIDSSEFSAGDSLLESGFDSISLTELSNRINGVYPGATTPAILLEYDTLSEIAAFLQKADNTAAKPVEAPAPQAVITTQGMTIAQMMLAQSPIVEKLETPSNSALTTDPAPTPAHTPVPVPAQGNDVAIIGFSCHYPQSPDPQSFWQTILNNRNAISAISDTRRAHETETLFADSSYSFACGFIEDIELFDADYFNISAREARMMDPQQRLMLEHSVKALADAGYDKNSISGSNTGVFVGAAASDYQNLLVKHGVIDAHYSTGVDHSIIANRVSYFLNLTGPSESLNTACSSALVALNRGKRAIQYGECEAALVAGVGCLLDHRLTEGFNLAGMLSPDNRCKTFDQSANGYVRAEGIGVVMLKAKTLAERDNDRIYALIKGSASNHGGSVRSLTVPNPDAQQAVIEKALNDANLSIADIDYIEAHGTATKLGDPVEANGLKRLALKQGFNTTNAIAIGAVKANIGHVEAGAGMAGVIKVLLMMKHRTITANSALNQINEYLELEGSPYYLPRESQPWQAKPGQPMRAGVSSFGFGGANAHVVLESVDSAVPAAVWPENMPYALFLSASSNEALRVQAQQTLGALSSKPFNDVLIDAINQQHQSHRLVICGEQRQVEAGLTQFINGRLADDCYHGERAAQSDLFNQELDGHELVSFLAGQGKWQSLFRLWSQGIEMDWQQLLFNGKQKSLPMPRFNRKRFWFDQIKGLTKASKVGPQVTDIKVDPEPTVVEPPAQQKAVQLVPIEGFALNPAQTVDNSKVQLASLENETQTVAIPVVEIPAADHNDMLNRCKQLLADVLLLDIDEVDAQTPFAELGLDSILTVEFVTQLNRQLQVQLNASDLYDCYNLERLAQKLARGNTQTTAIPQEVSRELVSNEPQAAAPVKPQTNSAGVSLESLTQWLAETLACEVDDLSADAPFSELGLDSILGVEFIKLVNQKTGQNLTTSVLFEHVSLKALQQKLASGSSSDNDLDTLLQQVYQGEVSADEAMKRGV